MLALCDDSDFIDKVFQDNIDDRLAEFFLECDNEDACNNILKVFVVLFRTGNLEDRAAFDRLLRAISHTLDKRSDSDLLAESLEFLQELFSAGERML
jgi:hypothetical protein